MRLFDGATTPPKHKRFLCVNPCEGWLLRINSRPFWRPHLLLPMADNEDCLDHDSYLELRGVIEYYETEIEDALRHPANHLGSLSREMLTLVIEHVKTAKTITSEERDRVIVNLMSVF